MLCMMVQLVEYWGYLQMAPTRLGQIATIAVSSLIALASLSACTPKPVSQQIKVLGSDTMEKLTADWVRMYMRGHEGEQILVKSGDTGAGIASLIAGEIDLAAASREMTAEERALAKSKGVRLKRVTVARDAVAIIVSPANKLSQISLEDLRKVYLGQTNTWQKLDPSQKSSEPIRAFGREASSGTSDYFQKHILDGAAYGGDVKLMPSSEAIIGGVMGNRLAIGFVGMAQAHQAQDKVKILKLNMSSTAANAVTTTAETTTAETSDEALSSDEYPLSRPLLFYYDLSNEPKIKTFVDYCLSEDGQSAVSEMGFMPARKINAEK